jgi:hypothetical protein
MDENGGHSALYQWFWAEHFWLPENTQWANLRSNATVQFPQYRELGYSLFFGVVLLAVRILAESLVFVPVGYAAGWMDPRKVGLLKTKLGKTRF